MKWVKINGIQTLCFCESMRPCVCWLAYELSGIKCKHVFPFAIVFNNLFSVQFCFSFFSFYWLRAAAHPNFSYNFVINLMIIFVFSVFHLHILDNIFDIDMHAAHTLFSYNAHTHIAWIFWCINYASQRTIRIVIIILRYCNENVDYYNPLS